MKTLKILSRALLSSSLAVSSLAHATLIPSDGSNGPGSDPLFGFQYSLQYTGQEIYRDITDIKSAKAIIDQNHLVDIGLTPNSNLDQLMKRDVLVAVLDSGVDLKHPDIVSALYRNTPECVSNDIPFGATEDKDHNGFIGDCTGWNFTAPTPNGNNRPEDDTGHGTHVSGIIAATRGNGIGIAGVSNRIKILPVKVTSALDARQPGQPRQGPSLAERMTKGIQYATQMKADVITMSLGWPSASDTAPLRQAMQAAMDAGITIVAAAGNNDTSAHVYPCAYEGVICVGATGIDNQLTDFSNFGGHVDMSAPGEEILSLFPSSLTPALFSGQQYEIKNGTSQAGPLVAASAAVLKGIKDGISEDEIKARLWLASQNLAPSTEDRFIQFGTLKLNQAINAQPQALTAPVFKNLDLVRFDLNNKNIQFDLPIKNYWLADNNIKVSVESLSPQLQITPTPALLNLSSSEKVNLSIQGKLLDPSASSEVKIKVTISSQKQNTRTYQHSFQLTRSITHDSKLMKLPLKINFNGPTPTLSRVPHFYEQNENPEYFWQEVTPNPNGTSEVKIHILKLVNGAYEEQPPLVVSGINQLLTFLKIPLMNHQQGYWIGAMSPAPNGRDKMIKYFNFNNDQQRSRVAQINFLPESAFITKETYKNLNFVDMKLAEGSSDSINVPVYINIGKIPKLDVNPDPLQFEVNNSQPRIFFLTPQLENGEWKFVTRNYDNYAFNEKLRAALHLQFKDDLMLAGLLPQREGQSSIRALFVYGRSDLRKFAVVSANAEQLLSHTFTLELANYQSTQLDKGQMKSVIDLSSDRSMTNSATSFDILITPVKRYVQYTSPQGLNKTGGFLIESSSPQDKLLDLFFQGYQDGNTFYSFTQSQTKLIFQVNSTDGTSARFENQINSSSLIPGSVFTEAFTPLTVSVGNRVKPAIYVDASLIYSRNVYLRVGDKNGLSAPASLNIEIPSDCRPISPQKLGSRAEFHFMMMCQTPTGAEIRALPMEE